MLKDLVVRNVLVVARLCVLIGVAVGSAQAQDVESGRQVFAGRCASCHGTGGAGGELGPSIVGRVPLRNDQELEAVIREGLPGSGMPAFATLARAESADLIAFLRTLRPRSNAGPRRASVGIAGGRTLEGIVLNQSHGELQILGDDRAVHLLRETTGGRYREVTSQTEWPSYNGQPSGNRYSPLAQHHREQRGPPRAAVGVHAAQRRPAAGDAGRRRRRDVCHRGE